MKVRDTVGKWMVLGERVAGLRKAAGMAQVELAVAIGDRYNQQMISHVENGRSGLLVDGLVQVAKIFRVSTDYLLGLTDDPTPAADLSNLDASLVDSGTRYIEVQEVAADAGGGIPRWDETVTGHLAFQQSWLMKHNIHPESATVMRVRGDSMEPTLLEDDSILVDTSRTAKREGYIFVVMLLGPGVVVKRAARDDSGEWVLASDNPAWDPISWPQDALTVGEVRWMGRTL